MGALAITVGLFFVRCGHERWPIEAPFTRRQYALRGRSI